MSLEDLLKDSNNSDKWKEQKRRIIRLFFGITVLAVGLIGLVYYLSTFKDDDKQSNNVASQEAEEKSLSELMRLRRETELLQKKIDSIKDKPNSKNTLTPDRSPSSVTKSSAGSEVIIDYDPGESFTNVETEKSNLYIPTGAVFKARLITPIKTSVQETFVMAETTSEYRMDSKRMIPKGSRLIGRSRLNPILKGVVVKFNTLVLPNGIEMSLSSIALSRNALPEIDGLYFSDKLENYGTALAFGFLSGFAQSAQEREETIFGSQPIESLENNVLSGLSTASFQIADDILRDIRERAVEYVVIPAGEPMFIALTRRYNINQGESR